MCSATPSQFKVQAAADSGPARNCGQLDGSGPPVEGSRVGGWIWPAFPAGAGWWGRGQFGTCPFRFCYRGARRTAARTGQVRHSSASSGSRKGPRWLHRLGLRRRPGDLPVRCRGW